MGKRRILILLPSFAGGGAERTVMNILRSIDRDRFQIKVVVLERSGAYLDQIDPDDVIGPRGQIMRFPWRVLKALLQMRSAIRDHRPDVVMTVTESMNYLGLLWRITLPGQRYQWWVRAGNNIVVEADDKRLPGLLKRLLLSAMRRVYQNADGVIGISDGVAQLISSIFQVESVRVIRNPVDITAIQALSLQPVNRDLPGRYVISVGRLTRQKGFDLLIQAYAGSRLPAWDVSLVILGDGPDHSALEEMAGALGVSDHVQLMGFQSNPYALMHRAEAFVLASRWEGFGHVVAEAMVCEVPVIVTDCGFGPEEIAEHGRLGCVVPAEDVPALTSAMEMMVSQKGTADRYRQAAREGVGVYETASVVREYETVFS